MAITSWRPGGNGNMSLRRPMSSAAMNNNPMGVQQTMQPAAAQARPAMQPSPAPVMPNGPDAFQPMQPSPAQEPQFTGSAAGRQRGMGMNAYPPSAGARAEDLKQQIAGYKASIATSKATPLAPTPPNPFFKPQGRDPQNPSQFAVQSVAPGSGNFVDRGGQTKPRQDTSMARNVMAGQPAEGSPNAGRPMNIPGATQTLGGRVVSDPQRYGQEGVIPGSLRDMSPMQGAMEGYSPDAFRVGTGGQPMIPYEPSGVAATDGRTARQTTIANRNARARGVRGSNVAEWRATSPSALIPQINREQQQSISDSNAAVNQWASQGNIPVQQQPVASPDPAVQPEGRQFSPDPALSQSPTAPASQAPAQTQSGTVGVLGYSADPAVRRQEIWKSIKGWRNSTFGRMLVPTQFSQPKP